MLDLLYFDSQLAVCVKPAGVLSEGEGENALPRLLSDALKEKNINATPFVVHRLDRETEGLTVLALNKSSAAALSQSFGNGDAVKKYHAICSGIIEKDSDTLCDLLFYDRKRGKSFAVDRERKGVKRASLEYEVIERFEDRTLISIRLHTGRTHQIRAQLASRGHSLCGDRRYGAPAKFGSKLCLCATSISFSHPSKGERMSFEISPSFPNFDNK